MSESPKVLTLFLGQRGFLLSWSSGPLHPLHSHLQWSTDDAAGGQNSVLFTASNTPTMLVTTCSLLHFELTFFSSGDKKIESSPHIHFSFTIFHINIDVLSPSPSRDAGGGRQRSTSVTANSIHERPSFASAMNTLLLHRHVHALQVFISYPTLSVIDEKSFAALPWLNHCSWQSEHAYDRRLAQDPVSCFGYQKKAHVTCNSCH